MTLTRAELPKELQNISDDELSLLSHLSSTKYRVNNLYTIKDKWNNEKVMKYNYAQNKLASYKHPRQIVLKSRQQGISTKKLARNLDRCIFIPGYEAGIQSYGKNESKKLATRAKLMWDRFPQIIKTFLKLEVIKMNSDEIVFSNGSILKIGNFRGDTLQSLHVSELGKIARKYPEKAEELKSGAFQAVAQGNIISIESTAEGKSGLFYEMWVKAVNTLKSGRELTPLDFQPVFLSWVEDPDCTLFHEVEISREDEEYFSKVEERLPSLNIFGCFVEKLTNEQKWWYVKKKEELGFKIKQEYPTFPEEAFEQSIEGTYYRSQYETLSIKENTYDENLVVFSAFDLGMNDTFSIGFFQIRPGNEPIAKRTTFIGEYENNDEGLDFYKDIFDALEREKGWQFSSTYVPHDITVKELTSAKTRWQKLRELGFKPILVKRHKLQDGIQATRDFLDLCTVDEECELILGAIQNYRKKYDDKFNVYLDAPVHDKYSHTADMIRYAAMGLKHNPPKDLIVSKLRTRRYKKMVKSKGFAI